MANRPVSSVANGASVVESRGLTGLRAVGALLVVLHHFYLHFGADPNQASFAGTFARGYLGVDLFFVLSGFVIAMVYGSWFTGPAGTALAGRPPMPGSAQLQALLVFLVRRAARLWPVHAVMLAIVIGLETNHEIHHTATNTVMNAAMIQAWGESRTINVPSWSVSTEWLAYLVFPLLAPFILERRHGAVLGIVLAVALLAAALVGAPPLGPGRRGLLDLYFNASLLPAARCLAGFSLGMATYRISRMPLVARMLANAWIGPATLAIVLALIVARANDLVIYALMPVTVIGIHLGHGPAWRLLATGPLHRLGVISYAFYLVHYAILTWFPFGAGPLWLELVAYMLVSLGAALLLHLVVELPGRRAIRVVGEALTLRAFRRLAAPPPLPGSSG